MSALANFELFLPSFGLPSLPYSELCRLDTEAQKSWPTIQRVMLTPGPAESSAGTGLKEHARARCKGLILLALVLELTQGKLFS